MAAFRGRSLQVTPETVQSQSDQAMTRPYGDTSDYGFPSVLDMLAEFGLDPDYDDNLMSYTYAFHSPDDEMELIVTYSGPMRYVAVTLMLKDADIFTVDTENVRSLRIVRERGACWLQASYKADRALPDLYIYLEPKFKCRW